MRKLVQKFFGYFLLFTFVAGVSPLVCAQHVTHIRGVNITVSNLEKSLEFYTGILPFQQDTVIVMRGAALQKLFDQNDTTLFIKVAKLHLGDEQIELWEFNSTSQPGRIIPADSRSNDLWFQHIAIVVKDIQQAYRILLENHVKHVSSSPQTLPIYIPNAAGISAFYFRDVDGHNLELISFPKGKGNPKWQKNKGQLFLGIDHTAIAISSTNESLSFYEKSLGLKVAGVSENYGTEQEHLNQVFGARLRITGLTADTGVGLEFLEYIAPPGGRNFPTDSNPWDIWNLQTSMKVDNVGDMFLKIKQSGYHIISTEIVSEGLAALGIQKGFVLKDAVGHTLLLYE